MDTVVAHYTVYFLVLLRIVAFVGSAPVLSQRNIPVWTKLGVAVFTALLVTPYVHGTPPSPFTDPGNYILAALLETVVGLLMGYLGTAVFSVLQMAGQMVDVQIGFSSAQLFDPQSSQTSGLTGSFNSLLFTLYFLGLNGLDGLLLTVMNSYQFIGLASFHAPLGMWRFLVHMLGMVMVLAVQLAAPLMAALLLTDITFAFLSRAVPQMNVYVVGLPAKLFVGLSLFVLVMPGVVYVFNQIFTLLFAQTNSLLQFMRG